MPEEPYNYDPYERAKRITIGASLLSMLSGITLSFVADKYGVARYQDTNDVLETVGAIIAIPAAAIFINAIDR